MSVQPEIAAVIRIVELAIRAPSFHNTQPWLWRWTSGRLELHADRGRQLPLSDPSGRNLLMSCGASLHHALVAAASLGWDPQVDRFPEGPASHVVARLLLRPGARAVTAVTDIRAIEERCTDRRGYTSWSVPDERLEHLAGLAELRGSHAVALVDPAARSRTEQLVNQAAEHQTSDDRIVAEQRAWVDRSAVDGIPPGVLPDRGPGIATGPVPRFPTGLLTDRRGEVESGDGLILFLAGTDEPATWLIAGEGLSSMWLGATEQGLSIVPLSQVIEVDETRRALRSTVLEGIGQPLILARVGWKDTSRTQIPRTPRRPLDDVLELA